MDLGKLYERGDFILLPTLKTYADALTFAKRAGYRNRDEEDESPRRPLTAVRNTLATVWPLFLHLCSLDALSDTLSSR